LSEPIGTAHHDDLGGIVLHNSPCVLSLVAVALAFSLTNTVCQQFEQFDALYGCEANPTGNPIGGDEGYSDIKSTGDFIVRTKQELLDALEKARANQVIFVPGDVEIDLGGTMGIRIPSGVTLAGDRGLRGSGGALFYNRTTTGTQFVTDGEYVRITGLRIEGPLAGTERIAESATGIQTTHFATEVDNCEIFNWNIQGVYTGRGASQVHVHHNHIHHCQRSGYGYGVVVYSSDVRIIGNIFDYCRHHIAAGGAPGCSYQAAWNYFSENCTSSLVDMHGGRDRGDNTDIAGDWMAVHHNTFAGPQRAIGIRGTPSQGAEIHNNWFSQPPEETNASTGNTRVYNNVYGPGKAPQEMAFEFVNTERVMRPEGFSDRLVPLIHPLGPQAAP
jgi:hypothetical protein